MVEACGYCNTREKLVRIANWIKAAGFYQIPHRNENLYGGGYNEVYVNSALVPYFRDVRPWCNYESKAWQHLQYREYKKKMHMSFEALQKYGVKL